MVRRPKAKICPETNKWLRNGASAKSGLNKALLSANLGQIRQYTDYKLAVQGKLMIKVKPHHSSQECSVCGYTHKDNRLTQALFKCGQCQQEMNADDNALIVLKKRGLKHIRSEAFSKEKTVRKISARKNTKAHELAPSGCGEDIRLASQATFCDSLNSLSMISSANVLSEARRL
jgi:putative transposase